MALMSAALQCSGWKLPISTYSALESLKDALDRLAIRGASAGFSTDATPSPLNWVFMGPPGVGKGTYASRMAKAFGLPHIATGDLIRAEITSGSTLGAEVRWSTSIHFRRAKTATNTC